jgi:hypothetical protein
MSDSTPLSVEISHFSIVALGALGLHQSQRFAVVAPEHLIHKAFAFFIRHARDRILPVPAAYPKALPLLSAAINKVVAGFGFGIVVGCRLILFLDRGNLGAQAFEFGIERLLSGEKLRELGVFFGKLSAQIPDVLSIGGGAKPVCGRCTRLLKQNVSEFVPNMERGQ